MMNHRKLLVAIVAALALLPSLAAVRPACCVPKTETVRTACCPAMATSHAAAPRGCCKAPVVPKPESRVKEGTPIALAIASLSAGSPPQVSVMLTGAVSVRLARHAHRADAPDDSPPDLLARNHVLLI